ncbi:hypothetical protein A8990_101361 [Paenibacillus taihuensis]|uniref:Uncharacterized protein n=1 Tax=Paenibacillus taihuensis TaxID=1156355 RepID=A0A3D9SNP2_9BACL|nr:hypothetical protein [Paenibacillus taihuensis]REE94565.1 hypothetical protein A8990_101361 [Paenibacillus taihuensis]
MATESTTGAAPRSFTVSSEIFTNPHLDIYSQMIYIVLSSSAADSMSLTLTDMSRKGRMTVKQVIKAMQDLADHKLISHKMFKHLIGEFNDDRLSWSAKGLLTYCKANPNVSLDELLAKSDQSSEDEQSVKRALQELKQSGYLDDFPDLKRIAN